MAGVLLLLLAPAPAAACDCMFKPISNAVGADYPFIFEGKVVERPMLTAPRISSMGKSQNRQTWKTRAHSPHRASRRVSTSQARAMPSAHGCSQT